VFFGSAMNNFGVEPFLAHLHRARAFAAPRESTHHGRVQADGEFFSGFVFKIQANMDPQHRDRIAFVAHLLGQLRAGHGRGHRRAL
jgi:peptide chain release factor 3